MRVEVRKTGFFQDTQERLCLEKTRFVQSIEFVVALWSSRSFFQNSKTSAMNDSMMRVRPARKPRCSNLEPIHRSVIIAVFTLGADIFTDTIVGNASKIFVRSAHAHATVLTRLNTAITCLQIPDFGVLPLLPQNSCGSILGCVDIWRSTPCDD